MSRRSNSIKKKLRKLRRNRPIRTIETLEAKTVLTGTFSFADGGVEWAYQFNGDSAADGGDEATSLDGTWSHDNGSDSWDGSEIGSEDGLPGGVIALTEGDGDDATDFIRVQDPGDPRDTLGASDPSNRKVYLTHNLSQDFAEDELPDNFDTIVDDGVTLYFKVRVATADTGPIDELHTDGGSESTDWPEDGLGYYQHNSGKSMIAIKQADGPNIAFGLDRSENVNEELLADEDGEPQEGLILPHLLQDGELSGDSDPSSTPDTLSTGTGNILAADDITEWQEYWVTIQAGTTPVDGFEDGTHIVTVYSATADDPLNANTFGITAATGDDVSGENYIAIGAGATGRAGAFDVDFFSWTPGVHTPSIVIGPKADLPDVGVAYQGEWDYAYDGGQDANDSGGALDGFWTHVENDRWDGSGPGEEGTAPGGIKSITEDDVTYLRVQDAGDPRGLGFDDAVSNRKMSLNRDVAGDDSNRDTFLDDGCAFSCRARVATDGPLDDVTFDGGQEPWPEGGRGSDIDFGGTGFITLSQGSGNAFSFALADLEVGLQDLPEDLRPEVGGLIMNNLAGTEPSGSVDTDDVNGLDVGLNLHPIADLTDWTEFWITIEADTSGGGTHRVEIYTNGATESDTYHITISNSDRFEEFCICPSFTSGATAVDIDYMAYSAGVQAPTLRDDSPDPIPGDANGSGTVDFADFLALSQNYGKVDAVFADGDFNGDGTVDFADFLILSGNYGESA